MLFIYVGFGTGLATFAGASALLTGGLPNLSSLPSPLLHVAGAVLISVVAVPLLTIIRHRTPVVLILIDEADRLRMASLEQVRAIFDAGEIGVILIGIPGLEKRLARYPVHEFRPLSATQVRQLLEQRWTPPGVNLSQQPWAEEAVAAIIRITGGNFRLLNRLLTQMERILEVNGLHEITKAVVETALGRLLLTPPHHLSERPNFVQPLGSTSPGR